MDSWMDSTLFDSFQLIGGGTPKTTNADFWGGDIPWLSVVDFNTGNKYVYKTEKSITDEGLNNSSTKLLNAGDVIISARGTVGVVSMLKKPMAFNQSCYGIKEKDGVSDKHYLYYLLADAVNNLKKISHGGVFDTITTDTFKEITIALPSVPEQKAIAEVLSSLDDKIDLLHRQNKTLESMAEALFRHHFIDNPQLDWEECSLSDIIDVRDGTHDSPKQKDSGKYLITSKHLKATGIDYDKAYKISNEDFDAVNKRSKVDGNDILFSMIGTLGLIHYVSDEPDYAIKNMGLFKTSAQPWFAKFLYLLLNSSIGLEFVREFSTGSTQQYITLTSLRAFKFTYPGKAKVECFDKQVEPYFFKIFKNYNQVKTLERLRDTLLPKLMNGEVRVQYEEAC